MILHFYQTFARILQNPRKDQHRLQHRGGKKVENFEMRR